MTLRARRFALATTLLLLWLPSPSGGQLLGAGPDPCRVVPYDGTPENAFGVSPGFTIEYCSELPPTFVECLWGGWYLVDPVYEVTRGATGAGTMGFGAWIRSGPGPGLPPGPILGEPNLFDANGVPVYPNVVEVSLLLSQAAGGSVDASTVLFACALLDAAANPDQFFAADQSPATPVVPCWGSSNGGAFESCQMFVPALRALGMGMLTSQFRASGTDDQVVPPTTSDRVIRARMNTIDSRALEFLVSGRHDVPNPIAVSIRRGPPGVVGSIVTTLPSAASPFEHPVVLSQADFGRLVTNRLYIDVVNAANPNGAARGQLTPANFIFGDGAESGTLDFWSSVQR